MTPDEIAASIRADNAAKEKPEPSAFQQVSRQARPERQQPRRARQQEEPDSKALPHSIDAEQGVLASMMVRFGGEGLVAIAKARDLLGPEYFYDSRHQILFRAMLDMFSQEAPIDIITLGEHLRSTGRELAAGGPGYYSTLSNQISAGAIDYYIQTVRDKYVLRELCRSSTENARQAMAPDADVGSILQLAHQRLALIESATSKFGRLPLLADISVLLNGTKPPRPPELIKGVLHQGSKLIVGGTSKGRKTFSLIDLGVSVAAGVPWWGFETAQGPVCYINFEIQESFFCERVEDICRVKNIKLPPAMFMGWNLRGHSEGIENLVEEMLAKLINLHFALVIFDPVYKALGDRDENKAGDVASLLNNLERVAVKTGAAIAFGAHYSKGNQAMKESIDRIGGSGVFARDPDSIMTMTAHEEAECFTVEPTLRNFKPIEPFVVKWAWPLFTRADDLDPGDLKQAKRASNTGQFTAKYSKDALLEELSVIDGVRPSALFKRLAEIEGISRAQFYRLAAQLRSAGSLKEENGLWFKQTTKKG